jgi:hypothetical protein
LSIMARPASVRTSIAICEQCELFSYVMEALSPNV